ncbi:PDZ domain-containing protein [Granulosicoccus antarcticus]|uniref:PDZ domain-containing protein n=1 Tax=Granulosicoccus antarcticus IMCC3135 TaxID=1192854 RepID=A0A2Z2NLV8_9GAMM|nr:PDZ domain-containing protein [Granulosicoccus antarcticus]ASJ72422.1 hypothetical protein IMCC3135_11660 [Granulosicoccus antarcticus IMCC3135]
MNEKQEGIMLINVAIAIFAGALSSVLILIFTHGFSMSDAVRDPGRVLSGEHATLLELDQDQPGPLSGNSTLLPGDGVSIELVQLQDSVIAAIEEREQLKATIDSLNTQVAKLEANMVNLESRLMSDGQIAATESVSVSAPGDGEAGSHAQFIGETPAERQYESLLASGLDEQSARDLQFRGDEYQLARLELFDLASREGWADSEQLDQRLEALNEESRPDLRSELGDGAYDRYLYESGRFNRVGIASVISGSAADQAGVQLGDVVSSYADELIFSVQDLQNSTRSGTRGEYVQLLVERNGEVQRTDIPRGPLGVTLQGIREKP